MVLCGGITGQDEAATPEIQSLVEQVKEAVHSNLNASFQVFQAVSFRTQVVAGRNYFVKVNSIFSLLFFIKSNPHFN